MINTNGLHENMIIKQEHLVMFRLVSWIISYIVKIQIGLFK